MVAGVERTGRRDCVRRGGGRRPWGSWARVVGGARCQDVELNRECGGTAQTAGRGRRGAGAQGRSCRSRNAMGVGVGCDNKQQVHRAALGSRQQQRATAKFAATMVVGGCDGGCAAACGCGQTAGPAKRVGACAASRCSACGSSPPRRQQPPKRLNNTRQKATAVHSCTGSQWGARPALPLRACVEHGTSPMMSACAAHEAGWPSDQTSPTLMSEKWVGWIVASVALSLLQLAGGSSSSSAAGPSTATLRRPVVVKAEAERGDDTDKDQHTVLNLKTGFIGCGQGRQAQCPMSCRRACASWDFNRGQSASAPAASPTGVVYD